MVQGRCQARSQAPQRGSEDLRGHHLLVVAAFGGALFMYTQGWGYPSQDSVATQLFADPDNASALYSAEVSDTSAASMTNSLVKDSAPHHQRRGEVHDRFHRVRDR